MRPNGTAEVDTKAPAPSKHRPRSVRRARAVQARASSRGTPRAHFGEHEPRVAKWSVWQGRGVPRPSQPARQTFLTEGRLLRRKALAGRSMEGVLGYASRGSRHGTTRQVALVHEGPVRSAERPGSRGHGDDGDVSGIERTTWWWANTPPRARRSCQSSGGSRERTALPSGVGASPRASSGVRSTGAGFREEYGSGRRRVEVPWCPSDSCSRERGPRERLARRKRQRVVGAVLQGEGKRVRVGCALGNILERSKRPRVGANRSEAPSTTEGVPRRKAKGL